MLKNNYIYILFIQQMLLSKAKYKLCANNQRLKVQNSNIISVIGPVDCWISLVRVKRPVQAFFFHFYHVYSFYFQFPHFYYLPVKKLDGMSFIKLCVGLMWKGDVRPKHRKFMLRKIFWFMTQYGHTSHTGFAL